MATYGPAKPGSSRIEVTAPCDGGTFTATAGPHGKGVEGTAVLKDPVHTQWFGGVSITPWRNVEGDPTLPRHRLVNGSVTLHTTNQEGADALHDPSLNYAWPQEIRAEIGTVKGPVLCNATVYLNASSGMVVSLPLSLNIDRDAGAISVRASPLLAAGPWQITATVTSVHGSQQESRTVKADKVGEFLGSPIALATDFTGFTDLRDFTSLTIKAQKSDGEHAYQVTLTRLP